MRKYTCDFYGCKEKCDNPASIAYDDGKELHFFCQIHKWAMNGRFKDAYDITGDAMEESPVNAQNCPETNERAVGVEDLRETAKRLIAARDERLKDRLIMHALGVTWD